MCEGVLTHHRKESLFVIFTGNPQFIGTCSVVWFSKSGRRGSESDSRIITWIAAVAFQCISIVRASKLLGCIPPPIASNNRNCLSSSRNSPVTVKSPSNVHSTSPYASLRPLTPFHCPYPRIVKLDLQQSSPYSIQIPVEHPIFRSPEPSV